MHAHEEKHPQLLESAWKTNHIISKRLTYRKRHYLKLNRLGEMRREIRILRVLRGQG